MIWDATVLEYFLRLMIARAGGAATFHSESSELTYGDSLNLFAEKTEDGLGITLSVMHVDEDKAGHA